MVQFYLKCWLVMITCMQDNTVQGLFEVSKGWGGDCGEEKKGVVANAYNVWLRECKLDASYLYFIPAETIASLKIMRGNAIYIIYDNSTWLLEDRGKNTNRFQKKVEEVEEKRFSVFGDRAFAGYFIFRKKLHISGQLIKIYFLLFLHVLYYYFQRQYAVLRGQVQQTQLFLCF